MKTLCSILVAGLMLALVGCGSRSSMPVFKHAISEYPSWIVYSVADKEGLINGKEGAPYGTLEKKHGVDIVLNIVDYDTCLQLYGTKNGRVDSVCITNTDILPIAQNRKSVAILPTSTSDGADQLLVLGIKDFEELKNHEIKVLTKSVAEFNVYRLIEKHGQKYSDYKIGHLDPAATATALASNTADKQGEYSGSIRAGGVWNPFATNAKEQNKDVKVLASSAELKEEIIDMVVIGEDSLAKPGGTDYANCLCDVYYTVCKLLNDPKTSDKTLKLLGEDFSNCTPEQMRVFVKETRFYDTPEKGIALFKGKTLPESMKTVDRVNRAYESLTGDSPKIGYGERGADLNFDTSYMK
jgi:hypothetical protein